jgi:hypothetical protein
MNSVNFEVMIPKECKSMATELDSLIDAMLQSGPEQYVIMKRDMSRNSRMSKYFVNRVCLRFLLQNKVVERNLNYEVVFLLITQKYISCCPLLHKDLTCELHRILGN